MKITLNNQERQILDDILTQKDENFDVSNLLNQFLEEQYDSITKKSLTEFMNKEGYDEKEAMEEAFFQLLSLDSSDPQVIKMKKDCGFGSLSVLDASLFKKEPFNHFPIKEVTLGSYQLSYNYFNPYEIFNCEDTIGDKDNNFAEENRLGYFQEKVPYLILSQKNEIWMSITPHEINTMRESIQKATGEVLTLGLGLGYYAYEVSNKDEVTSVTIIEKDSKVITLFEKNILPHFPHKEKIHIIKQDAFLYFERELKESSFDTIFIDIYHTATDALPMYLRFKEDERKFHYQPCDYWIEKSILCLLRRYILTLIEEYFQGLTKQDYLNPSSEEEKILLFLFNKLDSREFSSIQEITALLSDEGLKGLLAK